MKEEINAKALVRFEKTLPPFRAYSSEYRHGTPPPEELLVVEERQFARHVDAVGAKQPWQSKGIYGSKQWGHQVSCGI